MDELGWNNLYNLYNIYWLFALTYQINVPYQTQTKVGNLLYMPYGMKQRSYLKMKENDHSSKK